jgi:uncharacterized protein
MRVFVDTSGIFAALVESDTAHRSAKTALEKLARSRAGLVTSSYVLIETYALLQARVGLDAVRQFHDIWVREMEVIWVDKDLHGRGALRLFRADRRKLSLVDCVSFECMVQQSIERAFAVDAHFREAGFKLLIGGKNTA